MYVHLLILSFFFFLVLFQSGILYLQVLFLLLLYHLLSYNYLGIIIR